MTKTRAELVADVLEDLNEAGVGQPVSDEDAAKVTASLDAIFANLLARNVIFEPIQDEIADEQFDPLVAVVVGRHARSFGLGQNDRIKAELGVRLIHPDYRAGLAALLNGETRQTGEPDR